MRTVLMSFWPSIYNRILISDKIFEYRYRYCKEPTKVYMYVSKPIKQILGIVELGIPIDINQWKTEFSHLSNINTRIEQYLEKYTYAMPILSFQKTNSVSLETLKENIPNFNAPQSYIYVDRNQKLEEFLNQNIRPVEDKIINSFDNVIPDKICIGDIF